MRTDANKRLWIVVWTDAKGADAAVEHRGSKRHTLKEAERICDDMNAINPQFHHRPEKAEKEHAHA